MARPAATEPARAEPASGRRRASRLESLVPWLLGASFALLILVGVLGDSAATPPLGTRGWAPGALPWSPGSGLVSGGLAAAYVLGGVGLALNLRAPRPVPTRILAILGVGALLTRPFGSADHTNYAAYGRILGAGGNPWTESPIAWAGGHDPVTSLVQPPWQETPSVYGPVATILQWAAAGIGGDNLRQIVWVWQCLIVLVWLAGRWLMRRLFPDRPGFVDALWTVNPLLFGTGVLGVHVDLLATVLTVGALVLLRRAWVGATVAAGLIIGAAIAVKVTAGVVLLAAVIGVVMEARRTRAGLAGAVWRAAALVLGAALVALPAHLWAGAHVYDQLGRSRRAISLATPWRKVYEWISGEGIGGLFAGDGERSAVFAAACVLCVVLALAAWRVLGRPPAGTATRGDVAIVLTLVLSFAYAAGAPYALPWYDQLVWALLPGVLAGSGGLLLARLQIVRSMAMTLAYVPGRAIGMSASVEALSLGFRRNVAPVAAAVVWAVLVWLAARRPGTRPEPPDPRTAHPRT